VTEQQPIVLENVRVMTDAQKRLERSIERAAERLAALETRRQKQGR
jgi:hypothetical protein